MSNASGFKVLTSLFFIHWVSAFRELEQIWYDSMDNFTSHWITSGSPTQETNDSDSDFCTFPSTKCAVLRGYGNGSDWMVRTTSLSIIPNLVVFDSLVLQFDVTLYDMERTNFCEIKYKFDTDSTGDYTVLSSFSGWDSSSTIPIAHHNQTAYIDLSSNTAKSNNGTKPNVLYLRLEANGDSSSGNDYCYFDNLYLFGSAFNDTDVIWYDDLENMTASGWRQSTENHNDSVVQIMEDNDEHHEYCADGGCVFIRGFKGYENAIFVSIEGIDDFNDLILEFDAYSRNMEYKNGCQLFYKYDTDNEDDWFLLLSLIGGQGDQLYSHQMATIFENPQRHNATTLYLKLRNNGDSSSGVDYCYFDNIYVRGRRGRGDTDYFGGEEYDGNGVDGELVHLIHMSDMGGQSSYPYYTSEQMTSADMLSTVAKHHDITGIISCGDNIYSAGVYDEFDSRFQTTFEQVYDHSNIIDVDWWWTTGNHDYGNGYGYAGNITGEVEYSKHSKRWNFPSVYYTTSWHFANDIEVQWIALDTYILCGLVNDGGGNCNPPDNESALIHWQWLEDTLAASNATFKLVGGHTPIFSYAAHGPVGELIVELNPMLRKYGVNAYLFGHDHVMQYIEDNVTVENMVHHIGSGAGHGCRDSFSKINSELNPGLDALKYLDCNQGGFVRLTIDTKKAEMQAFYYLSNRPDVAFFSGIWDRNGNYKSIDEILYGTTMSPTFQPTMEPTTEPTLEPTMEPSMEPTLDPTTDPTLEPTMEPTMEPTTEPTTEPTNEPSMQPSMEPTDLTDGDDAKWSDSFVNEYKWYFIGGGAFMATVIGFLCCFSKRNQPFYVKPDGDDKYAALLENACNCDFKEEEAMRKGSHLELGSSLPRKP